MSQPILQVEHLKKYFPAGGRKVLRAVDDVSFSVQEGEILGIVGESGCGKTTCGRTAIGLYSKTDGVSLYRGEDIHRMRGAKRRAFCCQVQTVFQDPYASLDPKNKVIDLIAEGMDIHHLYTGPAERREKVQALCAQRRLACYIPPLSLCGDNASMIGSMGYYEYLAGTRADLSLNAVATCKLG